MIRVLLGAALMIPVASSADSHFSTNTQIIWDYALSPVARYRVDPTRILISPHSFTIDEAKTILNELAADPPARQANARGRIFREQQSELIWREILKSNEFDFAVFEQFTSQFENLLRQLQRLEGRETTLRRLMAEQNARQEMGIMNRQILERPPNVDLRMMWQRRTRQELTRSNHLQTANSTEQLRLLEEWRQNQLQLLKRHLTESVGRVLDLRLRFFNGWLVLTSAVPGKLLSDEARLIKGDDLKPFHLKQMELVYYPTLRTLDLSSAPKTQSAPMVAEWYLRDQTGQHFALITPSMGSIKNLKGGRWVSLAFADNWLSVEHPDDFAKTNLESIRRSWTVEMANALIGNLHLLIDALEDLDLHSALPQIKNHIRETLWRIQRGTPGPEDLRESEIDDSRRPEIRQLLDTLVNWRWWGLAISDSYWSDRSLEANRKKVPVLKWKGSEEASLKNSASETGRMAAEVLDDLTNSPADQSGYAFSVERSLFSFMPPRYFDYPSIGSEEAKERVNLQTDAKGDLFLRSLIPSQVANDGRFPIPTPDGFELVDLSVRKSEAIDSTEVAVQTWKTTRGYQAETVGEKISEVFFAAVFRYKEEPKSYAPKENLLLKLPWNGLQRVAEKMRASSLTSLSAALDRLLAGGRIVSAQDLAKLISQNSLYSYHPSPTLRGAFDSFDALTGFLNSGGTLCIQCNVAAALLANWLKEIWAGVEGVEVRVVTVLRYEDGSLRRVPHAVVEVRQNGARLALLDTTPDALDPRAPMPPEAMQFKAVSSSGLPFEHEVDILERARSELLSKAEFFTPRRASVFEAQSEFVQLNVTAQAVVDWIHNDRSYEDLLQQAGVKSFAKLQSRVIDLALSSKRWTQDLPGQLTQKEKVVRDFYRGIEPEVEQLATALKRILKAVADKNSCNENLR